VGEGGRGEERGFFGPTQVEPGALKKVTLYAAIRPGLQFEEKETGRGGGGKDGNPKIEKISTLVVN